MAVQGRGKRDRSRKGWLGAAMEDAVKVGAVEGDEVDWIYGCGEAEKGAAESRGRKRSLNKENLDGDCHLKRRSRSEFHNRDEHSRVPCF